MTQAPFCPLYGELYGSQWERGIHVFTLTSTTRQRHVNNNHNLKSLKAPTTMSSSGVDSELECGVCMDKQPVIRMPCCKFNLCVPCGERIVSRRGVGHKAELKCPQCREMHDASLLTDCAVVTSAAAGSGSGGGAEDDMDLETAMAASLLALEEEKKARETAEAEWSQQLEAALRASELCALAERSQQEESAAAEDVDLAEAIRVSKRVRNWEDDQLEWAGVDASVVGEDEDGPIYRSPESLLSFSDDDQGLPSNRNPKRARVRFSEGPSEGAAASAAVVAPGTSFTFGAFPAPKKPMVILPRPLVECPAPSYGPPPVRGPAAPVALAAPVAPAGASRAQKTAASVGPSSKAAGRSAGAAARGDEELTGFKLIRCRVPPVGEDGASGKRPKVCLGGDVEADVSLNAALALSLRPKWMEARDRELGLTGLEKKCCGADGAGSSSCNCVDVSSKGPKGGQSSLKAKSKK